MAKRQIRKLFSAAFRSLMAKICISLFILDSASKSHLLLIKTTQNLQTKSKGNFCLMML
jgi:hypothetical protein